MYCQPPASFLHMNFVSLNACSSWSVCANNKEMKRPKEEISPECPEMHGVYFGNGDSKKKEKVETSRKCAELCTKDRHRQVIIFHFNLLVFVQVHILAMS